MTGKSSVDEIRARFDNDVERFSNLETGQSATVDAPLTLELIAQSAASVAANATALLDIGCGAGNFSLKLLDALPRIEHITLIDLSLPMLGRARTRILARKEISLAPLQSDVRQAELPEETFDVAVAAAVLHHLRGEEEWRSVFRKIYLALRPNGSFWVSDLVSHAIPAVQSVMWRRYGEYLADFKGPDYRDHVFGYIEQEDTPRPLTFQLDVMREAGFRTVDVIHKNSCFGAFVGIK
jgi:tRNA (cmo5U34)-methyltransferase